MVVVSPSYRTKGPKFESKTQRTRRDIVIGVPDFLIPALSPSKTELVKVDG